MHELPYAVHDAMFRSVQCMKYCNLCAVHEVLYLLCMNFCSLCTGSVQQEEGRTSTANCSDCHAAAYSKQAPVSVPSGPLVYLHLMRCSTVTERYSRVEQLAADATAAAKKSAQGIQRTLSSQNAEADSKCAKLQSKQVIMQHEITALEEHTDRLTCDLLESQRVAASAQEEAEAAHSKAERTKDKLTRHAGIVAALGKQIQDLRCPHSW